MSTHFILPQKNDSFIAQIVNGAIEKVKPIDVTFKSKNVITENGSIISIIHSEENDEKQIRVFNKEGGLLWMKLGIAYNSLACKGNAVYFGGIQGDHYTSDAAMFAWMNLDDQVYDPTRLDVPIESKSGKSIDDVVVDGEQLILVDNIIYPKFIFFYDISDEQNPIYKQACELPNNGTYEHIEKADAANGKVVTLSSTIGGMGGFDYISIIDTEQLKRFKKASADDENWLDYEAKGVICNHDFDDKTGAQRTTYPYFGSRNINDICLIGNYLFFLLSDELKCINIQKPIEVENCVKIDINIQSPKRLIKSSCGNLVILAPNEYELVLVASIKLY